MFTALMNAGIPLGPLAAPRQVWMLPSGRGHMHLTQTCRSGLTPRSGILANMTDAQQCSDCLRLLTPAERYYRKFATSMIHAMDYASAMLRRANGVGAVEAASLGFYSWMATTPGLRGPGPHWDDMSEWLDTVAAPRLGAALDAVEQRDCAAPDRSSALRGAAAAAAHRDISGRVSKGAFLPALIPAEGDGSTAGQNGLVFLLLQAVRELFETTGPEDLSGRAVRKVKPQLDSQQGPVHLSQQPRTAAVPAGDFATLGDLLDAAWHQAAEAELHELANLFVALACEHLAAMSQEVEHLVVYRFAPGPQPENGDAHLSAHVVDASRPDAVLLSIRPCVYAWARESKSTVLAPRVDLGPVPDVYSPELVSDALDLISNVAGLDPFQAVEVARAALV